MIPAILTTWLRLALDNAMKQYDVVFFEMSSKAKALELVKKLPDGEIESRNLNPELGGLRVWPAYLERGAVSHAVPVCRNFPGSSAVRVGSKEWVEANIDFDHRELGHAQGIVAGNLRPCFWLSEEFKKEESDQIAREKFQAENQKFFSAHPWEDFIGMTCHYIGKFFALPFSICQYLVRLTCFLPFIGIRSWNRFVTPARQALDPIQRAFSDLGAAKVGVKGVGKSGAKVG